MPTPHDSTIEHYRHAARHLQKALQAEEADAAPRISRNLSRLSDAAPKEIFAADIGLQECQHVVAREHGYDNWAQVVDFGEPRIEDITLLSDADIRVLLNEIGPEDMATALRGMADGPVSKMHHAVLGLQRQMPPAVQDELRRRAGEVKPDPAVLADTQRRIALQARLLEEQGLIRRGRADGEPSEPPAAVALPPGLDTWDRAVEQLSPEEIRVGLTALAVARETGVLEAAIPEDGSAEALNQFVWQGVRLVVDQMEPALLRDILQTHAWTALRHVDLRWRITIEATISIAFGDNPRVVLLKLAPIYTTDPKPSYRAVEGTVELALKRLQQTPASQMTLAEICELYTDIAWIARVASAVHEDGLSVLLPIAEAMDDQLMADGLRMLAERVGVGHFRPGPADDESRAVNHQIMDEMERVVPSRLAQVKLKYDLICAGIAAIAEGCTSEGLADVLDGVTLEEEVRIYK